MPEIVHRPGSGLPSFPAGEGKGAHYTPLPRETKKGVVQAHAVQTILADRRQLFELWKNVTLAPLWQEYVVSVEPKSETISHWVLGDPEDPNGKRLEFDSEIHSVVPGERIAWRSVTSEVNESGEVRFEEAENGRGTRVTLLESIAPPGGSLGAAAAAVAKRSPQQIVIEDLRHFKQLAEAGEIPRVEGQPHGPRGAVGGFKKRVYGENNPTPAGTSEAA